MRGPSPLDANVTQALSHTPEEPSAAHGPQASTTRSTVVFSHATALQLARTTRTNTQARNRRPFFLPPAAPRLDDLSTAARELRASNPEALLRAPVHCIVRSSTTQRAPQPCRFHQHSSEIPRGAAFRVSSSAWCASPELAFVQEAALESNVFRLALLGWELCGTYCTASTGHETTYQLQQLTSHERLSDFARRNAHMRGSQKALRALRFVKDNAASPRESMLALVLGLPSMYGGHALGMPLMNHPVEATPQARAIAGRASFRCDLCWPHARLDVEYQSAETHAGEIARIGDSRRANALSSMGWTVVAITNDELNSASTMEEIAKTLRKLLGKRLRADAASHRARQLELRRSIGLPAWR